MPTSDVLILAVARQGSGATIAGMTTERDAKTGLRWVRPMTADGPLELDALRYADGNLMRPGDVARVMLDAPRPSVPHVENVLIDLEGQSPERVRRLSPERREVFFREHLDTAPVEVLKERSRSLCLIRPDFLHAIIAYDEETAKFDARLALDVSLGTGKLRSNEEGIAVTDLYWRALMRTWLGEEAFAEVEDAELRERLGEVYVVVGLGPRGGPLILGVHTVPEYEVTLDEDAL